MTNERIQELLKDFVANYAKLNGVKPQLATPKYDHYVEGASDFADELERLGGSGEPPQPRCPSCKVNWNVRPDDFREWIEEGRFKVFCSYCSETFTVLHLEAFAQFFGPSAPQPQPIWAEPSAQQMEAAKAHVRDFFPDSDPDAVEALARSHIQYASAPSAPSGSAGRKCKHCGKEIVRDKSLGWVTACFGDILCFTETSRNPRQGGHEPSKRSGGTITVRSTGIICFKKMASQRT